MAGYSARAQHRRAPSRPQLRQHGPYTHGLTSLVLGDGRDLVGGPTTITGDLLGGGTYGPELVFDAHTSADKVSLDIPDTNNRLVDCAWLAVLRYDGASAHSNEYVIFSNWTGGANDNAILSGAAIEDGKYHAYMGIRHGSDYRVYEDGAQLGSATLVTSTMRDNLLVRWDSTNNDLETFFSDGGGGGSPAVGHYVLNNGDTWQGGIAAFALWTSTFGQNDAPDFECGPALTRTPYAWMELLRPRSVWVPVAGGATTHEGAFTLGADAGVTLAADMVGEVSLSVPVSLASTFAADATFEPTVTFGVDAGDSYAAIATIEAALTLASSKGATFAGGLVVEGALALAADAALTPDAEITIEGALALGAQLAVAQSVAAVFEADLSVDAVLSVAQQAIANYESALALGADTGLTAAAQMVTEGGLTFAVDLTLTDDGTIASVTVVTPDEQILRIAADGRVLRIAADGRSLKIH